MTFTKAQLPEPDESRRAVFSTTPRNQATEFDELLALARCVNRDFGMLALLYGQISRSLQYRCEIEVLPDDQAERVEERRGHLADASRALGRSPMYLATFEAPAEELTEDAEGASLVAFALLSTLKSEIPEHWRDIRALEDCIEEVRERFGGEDPADPTAREALENAKAGHARGTACRYAD